MASTCGLILILLLHSFPGDTAHISSPGAHTRTGKAVQDDETISSASDVVNKQHQISRKSLSFSSSHLIRNVRDATDSRRSDPGKFLPTPNVGTSPSIPEDAVVTKTLSTMGTAAGVTGMSFLELSTSTSVDSRSRNTASLALVLSSQHIEGTTGPTTNITPSMTALTHEAVSTPSAGHTNGLPGISRTTADMTSTLPQTSVSGSTTVFSSAQGRLSIQSLIPTTSSAKVEAHSGPTRGKDGVSRGAFVTESVGDVTSLRTSETTSSIISPTTTSSQSTMAIPTPTDAAGQTARTTQGVTGRSAATLSTHRQALESTSRASSGGTMLSTTSVTTSSTLTDGTTGRSVPPTSMSVSSGSVASSVSFVDTSSSRQPVQQSSASRLSGTTAPSRSVTASGNSSIFSTPSVTTAPRMTSPQTSTHGATAQSRFTSEETPTASTEVSKLSTPAQSDTPVSSSRETLLPVSRTGDMHVQTKKPKVRTHTRHNEKMATTTASVGKKINYDDLSNQEKYIIVGSLVGAVLIIVVIVFFVILRGGISSKGRRGSVYITDAINLQTAEDRTRPDLEAMEKEAEKKQKEGPAGKLVIDG